MEYRRLNITLLSAQGLKDVNHFSKMDVYADVSLAGYPRSRQRTPVDKNSGTSPKWNHRMEFVVDEPYLTKPGLSLIFQLRTQSTFGPDKDIGAITVPVHDLFRPNSTSADQTVDYQVIIPSGKPKGTLKFAYKFGDKFTHQPEPKRADEPVTAYPPSQYAYRPAPHPGAAYPPPPQAAGYGYGYGAYPTTSGYGQPQGYPAAPPAGYGYAPAGYPAYTQPQKLKKNKMGMGGGMGLGLGAGLLGGLLVGEMASDIGESAAYADGYGDAMGDMGDFDF